jgi:protein-serine/threonine kinase
MAVPANRRPLPSIPPQVQQGRYPSPATLRGPPHSSADMYAQNSPYYSDYPYAAPFSFAYPDAGPSSPPMGMSAPPLSSLPGGTILHRGFYDLLSLIPTTSPNRLWRAQPQPPKEEVKAIRYEEMQEGRTVVPRPGNYGPPLPPVPLKKGRKVNKDMVSHPTGFM